MESIKTKFPNALQNTFHEIDDYLKATFNHQLSSAQNNSVKTKATSKSTAKKLFLE